MICDPYVRLTTRTTGEGGHTGPPLQNHCVSRSRTGAGACPGTCVSARPRNRVFQQPPQGGSGFCFSSVVSNPRLACRLVSLILTSRRSRVSKDARSPRREAFDSPRPSTGSGQGPSIRRLRRLLRVRREASAVCGVVEKALAGRSGAHRRGRILCGPAFSSSQCGSHDMCGALPRRERHLPTSAKRNVEADPCVRTWTPTRTQAVFGEGLAQDGPARPRIRPLGCGVSSAAGPYGDAGIGAESTRRTRRPAACARLLRDAFRGGYAFMRAFSGSNIAEGGATVTGRRSFIYTTCSLLPAAA